MKRQKAQRWEPGEQAECGCGQDEQGYAGADRGQRVDQRGHQDRVPAADRGIQGAAEVQLLGDAVDRGEQRHQGQ